MFQLNELTKLVKKRKQIGRGGKRGGTSGRGNKGQKARTGDAGIGYGFEGGQTPLARHLPKRGFNNARFADDISIVNLVDLEQVFNDGDEITVENLLKTGLVKKAKGLKGAQKDLIKVLGSGEVTKKLIISGLRISASAQKAIEKVGGKVVNN